MYEAPSEAKNTYALANSTGCPSLPKVVVLPNSEISSALKEDGIKGVQIGPGATVFTLMFLLAKDCDSDLVKDTIAPLVEE